MSDRCYVCEEEGRSGSSVGYCKDCSRPICQEHLLLKGGIWEQLDDLELIILCNECA